MNTDALLKLIDEDKTAGKTPVLLVAYAGMTGLLYNLLYIVHAFISQGIYSRYNIIWVSARIFIPWAILRATKDFGKPNTIFKPFWLTLCHIALQIAFG